MEGFYGPRSCLNGAQKHGLAVFDPQRIKIRYPTDQK
jgi:hypothetical protein